MTGGGALLGSDRCRHAEHVMGTVVSFDVPACAREPRAPAGQTGGPLAGQPPVGLASITVVGATLTETDAFATAAFAMGSAARDWVESLDGYEAFAITAVGATWQTSGFGAYLS